MDPFASLSIDQLAQVLAHVHIRARLSTCSLVSSTWRAAAASATTAIAVRRCSAAFVDWLHSHTAAVQVTSVSLDETYGSNPVVLPLAQLRSLRSLELDLGPRGWLPGTPATAASVSSRTRSKSSSRSSNTAAAAAADAAGGVGGGGGIEQLTALTQLKLTGCSVKLAGLSALTGLLDLSCAGYELPHPPNGPTLTTGSSWVHDNHIADFQATEDQLVAALPRLQRLTSLRLEHDIGSATVLAHISALRSLQQLEVVKTRAGLSAAQLHESLTRLHFSQASSSTDIPHAITTANASSLLRLTALQSLHLESVRALDAGLLAGMMQLRELRLTDVEHAAGTRGLAVVSCFTGLTALTIDGYKFSKCTMAAAETEALTASPHLASFTFSGMQKLAPSSWADVFPPGRQWHSLTKLTLPADFLQSPDTVRLVGRCAPNLQQVEFDRSQSSGGLLGQQPLQEGQQQAHVAEGVAALAGWPRLRHVFFRNPWLTVPGCVWESLGALSQIRSLFMCLEQEPSTGDVLCLEGCTSLQCLYIYCWGWLCPWLEIHSTAAPGNPPNVSQRLADEVPPAEQ